MNKYVNSLQISEGPYKENDFYDDKEVNIEKESTEKYYCECEEQININSELINSLKVRIEKLETDFGVKDQDIKNLQQKFKLARLSAVNDRQVVDRFYEPQISLATQDIKNYFSSNKLKSNEVDGYKDDALYNARMIIDLDSIKYPPHIKSPNPALNINAEPGKFRYDRNFMMQFMCICRERPKNLDDIFTDMPISHSTRRRTNRNKSEKVSPTAEIFEYILSNGARQVQEQNVKRENDTHIELSEDRKVPSSDLGILPKTTEDIHIAIRDIRELLKKLTFDEFDSISDQIIEYANRSRDEQDGRILRELSHLVIERLKPQDICAVYAQLCRKIIEKIDPKIVDENVKNTEGKYIQGGALFRKYLLTRCQDDFEKGWEMPFNEKSESNLSSDAAKSRKRAKRRGLGLICFISELFKLNMVTERIMHECIKKLLLFQDLPGEEEMDVLCKLMNTIGDKLDHVEIDQPEHTYNIAKFDHNKAKQHMDAYFTVMVGITKIPNLSTRIKSMLMSIIDLRNNDWKPLDPPKKIENAEKQKEDTESPKKSSSGDRGMPEPMSPKGSNSHEHQLDKETTSQESENEGWNVVGKNSSSSSLKYDNNKAADLTKFGSMGRFRISGKVSLIPGGTYGVLSGAAKGWSKANLTPGGTSK
ncbi:hypothetical protein RclHR1_11210004 [Rhizophagus clarus]|uniref:Armadillo-type protein n=1 Tax=Rhizophagus clarus TaxID=94130 RepID=A0A2Z6Q3T1_9GLOM|nr:hypothetical protein RclHR1_11210004 [Rhizophagus clarus]GES94082.1 armadillo-type protein [Rhizophagus clarus]